MKEATVEMVTVREESGWLIATMDTGVDRIFVRAKTEEVLLQRCLTAYIPIDDVEIALRKMSCCSEAQSVG